MTDDVDGRDEEGTEGDEMDGSDDAGTEGDEMDGSDDVGTEEDDVDGSDDVGTEEDDVDGSDDGQVDVELRHGRETDLLAVLRTLEGAMLEVGATQIRTRTESGEVLVAEVDGRVVGALVRDGEHVEAVAVRPQYRGRGIGRRLIEETLAETGTVTVEFREAVRPFYEKLGFDIEAGDERLRGERTTTASRPDSGTEREPN